MCVCKYSSPQQVNLHLRLQPQPFNRKKYIKGQSDKHENQTDQIQERTESSKTFLTSTFHPYPHPQSMQSCIGFFSKDHKVNTRVVEISTPLFVPPACSLTSDFKLRNVKQQADTIGFSLG